MTTDLDPGLVRLLASSRRGVLGTIRRDGRPQLSNVDYAYDPERAMVRVSVTDDRAKARNLRRDPRAVLHVTTPDLGAYVVIDGVATLSAVAGDPHDEAVNELVSVYRAISGEHPDWDEYRAAMVADHRLVVRLPAGRGYGWAPRAG
ncbi:MAG: PPOX class F420-dependent oxidoreductase [bacterium]